MITPKIARALVLSLLAALALSGTAAQAAPAVKPKPGYAAPALHLQGMNELDYETGGQSDKLVLLNFWASWCGPCGMEAPMLQALHRELPDTVAMYGINATAYDSERHAREFVEHYGLTFPILMDRNGKATELYKVSQFPTTLLIDRKGVVRERVIGVIDKEDWMARIQKWNQAGKAERAENS
ncbi:TlpA family protein disulfide reductase [Paenibacillus sp. IB182496]|uniref:TlpA family protein disulfide reductase n=1 Tax=Paenibacillus sabuli TaxID=2772509 RepID=A0A927BSP1_9BACL|nr:TlpA disulfide reductase family protein [Paenibacillus sabuli]MBD2846056.1 TlpA family protein disulfide reductase [Paenibacillus sabuli]